MIEWNADPIIGTLGPLQPRWYGVLFASAFLFSYAVMKRVFLMEGKHQNDLDRLTIYMMIGTVLGARLGHVLFYEPGIILQDPFEVIAIWHGGLASHGGAIGIILAVLLFSRNTRGFSMTWLLDRLAIVVPLSGMCIRLGNLMNSEIIGRPTDMPWGFWFMRVDAVPVARHPTQIYEALICLVLFLLMMLLYRKGVASFRPGFMIGLLMVLLFTSRFFVEFYKEVQEAFEASLPIDMGQILSIPFIVAGIIFIMRSARTSSAR